MDDISKEDLNIMPFFENSKEGKDLHRIVLLAYKNQIKCRILLIYFSLTCYAFLLFSTITIYFLQGFHISNFQLGQGLLQSLTVVSIGEAASMIILITKAIFGPTIPFPLKQKLKELKTIN